MAETRCTGILLAMLLAALPAAAQEEGGTSPTTAEEVLARHVAARGGAERWREVETLRVTGTYTAFSEDAPFILLRRRPALYRFDYTMLGEPVTEVWDGETGWLRNAHEGFPEPVKMNRAQIDAVVGEAEFDSPLMDVAARGHRVELVGRSDFDGIDAWELKVTRADGKEETWYLDVESYLAVGRVAPAVDFGRAVGTQKMFFDDHREVGGIVFPFYMETEYFIRHRTWVVDAVEINPEVAAESFALPPPEAMVALAALAGDWEVKVESRPVPRAPWSESAGTATLSPRLYGTLIEERLALEIDGRPVEALRTFGHDRERGVYRLVHTDDLTKQTEILEGSFEEGRLVLAELEVGAAAESGEAGGEEGDGESGEEGSGPPAPRRREVVSEISAEGFFVEREVTPDGGETWIPELKLSYRRPGAAEETPEE